MPRRGRMPLVAIRLPGLVVIRLCVQTPVLRSDRRHVRRTPSNFQNLESHTDALSVCTPGRRDRRAGGIAFRGCDHECAQAHSRGRVCLSDAAGRGAGRHRERSYRAGVVLHREQALVRHLAASASPLSRCDTQTPTQSRLAVRRLRTGRRRRRIRAQPRARCSGRPWRWLRGSSTQRA
jgi:hypothetical protein